MSVMAEPSDIEAELVAINKQIGVLVEEIRLLRAQLPQRSDEPEKFKALLHAIFPVQGNASWAVAWIMEASLDSMPGTLELRAAIVAVVGRRNKHGVRCLGKFIAKHVGREADGLKMLRLSESHRDGHLYQVVRVSKSQ